MIKTWLYITFSIIAIISNLIAQEITTVFVQLEYEIFSSILIGTLTGLFVKYLLDKKYIFKYTTKSQTHEFTTFFLYSLMGVITTLLFWITEYTFHLVYETKTMRYVGAIIGLSIGYITKYYLDKRYVFIECSDG